MVVEMREEIEEEREGGRREGGEGEGMTDTYMYCTRLPSSL